MTFNKLICLQNVHILQEKHRQLTIMTFDKFFSNCRHLTKIYFCPTIWQTKFFPNVDILWNNFFQMLALHKILFFQRVAFLQWVMKIIDYQIYFLSSPYFKIHGILSILNSNYILGNLQDQIKSKIGLIPMIRPKM